METPENYEFMLVSVDTSRLQEDMPHETRQA